MKHVLIVEDEKKLADVLIGSLVKDQFKTAHFESGEGVVDWVRIINPTLLCSI